MHQEPLPASSPSRLESPGQRLRRQRLKLGLTQEALAEALGVSARSISRWEQDQAIPQEVVRQRLRTAFGMDLQVLPAVVDGNSAEALATTPPLWYVPFHRNPFFTGREEILYTLHQGLSHKGSMALTQSWAVNGLGGIGKTQIALEYAYRFAHVYTAILWITAETPESILTSLSAIAALLPGGEKHESDQQKVAALVSRWLSANREWLLIVDNVEDLEVVEHFLPPTRHGSLLFTTRMQALGALAHPLELPPMTVEEGTRFMLRRVKRLAPAISPNHHAPIDEVSAREIVVAMGGLPLALDQAGAYIEETGCGLADYLQRYEQQRAQFLNRRGIRGGDHPQSVMATFQLIWRRLEREHPAAANLLRVCAFLHAEAIPEELFTAGASHLGPVLAPVATDPYLLDDAIAALRAFSLVQRYAETRTLSIHRVVQAVIQDSMDATTARYWGEHAIQTVNAVFPTVTTPFPEPGFWLQCERYLPHAIVCQQHMEKLNITIPEAMHLLLQTGAYLLEQARITEAEAALVRARNLGEQQFGSDHPQILDILQQLAKVYWRQEKFLQAEKLFLYLLPFWEQQGAPDHLKTTDTLDSLAALAWNQGRYAQAEELWQRALTICERHLEPTHPQTAGLLHNLAVLYRSQGKFEQAEPLFICALAQREQHFGPTHPDVAVSLSGLAALYEKQGRDEEAESLFERALAIRQQHYGWTHPTTARSLGGVATMYAKRGKQAQAEALWRQALLNHEQHLGPDHQDIAFCLDHLAELCREQGKYAEAVSLFQRALTIQERLLGPVHPDVARSVKGLAKVYEKWGISEQAESMLARACTVFEECLGLSHPETMEALNDYQCLLEQRRKAAQMFTEGSR